MRFTSKKECPEGHSVVFILFLNKVYCKAADFVLISLLQWEKVAPSVTDEVSYF